MRRIDNRKSLLDKMSRSEENNLKTLAMKCIRFSVLGNAALLVTCFFNTQDILQLKNPAIKLLLLVGLFCFEIGCGGLVVKKYVNKREGEKYER